MSGVNKVILVGNLGRDPEIRHIDGNISVAKFPLATSEVYKNKDGQRVTQTEWHNVVLWRQLAETAEKFLKKGSLVYIEGKLRTRNWDDKEGNKKYITEVIGDSMTLLGRKPDENGNPSTGANDRTTSEHHIPDAGQSEMNDDLPF
ncbi:MAG: single-stranded DNA-binding protein [Bacteroidetes bacterium]|jgi:single-strand DNA-binding protein|nr:single-stranded DNA-binding protein [Bacteroidota bacterium]MBX7238645.1 single-stranded DNA-binding protein [Bacteroidia bacterium]MCC7513694.1 single-stranded DNA-binding protein [Bacteroidia bacterium]HMU76369.1 single-stranded DNA-binding protein [Bacteroidia bacterium]HMW10458.1 single-stranded DNA-binding protein [Bacteroidia bacterium]